MCSPRFNRVYGIALWLVLGLTTPSLLIAQDTDSDEAKEKSIADRFAVVLEKNPRRGTALDKVYGYHVERGSLEGLIAGYREKAKTLNGAEVGHIWMIIGLLESLRGRDASAVAAFEHAETSSSDNYLASYYLGQSLVLVGQPDKAAEALERSIQRKPAPSDLLEIFQSLGRIYQRAQKSDKALDVWNRLEKQFPNDARVQEQIATTLLQENEFAAALPRYELLAKTTKDQYRQSMFQMEAADIKVRLGKSDEAIKDFELLLGRLLPENWLYREVRRRIESAYLRTDDQAGLISYYEAWLKKSPKDLEAISRLARLLAGYGRSADAQLWLENGLKLAPTKKEIRQALINLFLFEHKFVDAILQYEQLDKYEPDNPDTLREWGRLILKDHSKDEASRKQAAAAVWRRLMKARPKDPLVVSQVGELFRHAEMTNEALELYEKAVSLAPDQAQYREYLGEYLHALKRSDEALATWRGIAEDKLKTPQNVARLAEVLRNFGYLSEAVQTNAEACQLDPRDFSLQLKQVDLLAQAERHDEAIEQLVVVKKMAASDEEREAWLVRDLRELHAADKLKDRIEDFSKDVDSKDAEHWFWLARAFESERRLKEAARAIMKAGECGPQSIPILKASARILESSNNLMTAVEINTKLATIDRRYRTEYLKQVAMLEQKLGRRTRAIQAGRDLIAAAPGNPELYEFFSQLCFQLGETDEGLAALRRSVRVNPTETKGMLLLASALGEQFRTSEAIELYWRAFDIATNLDARLEIVPKLAELYLQTNQFDRMLERLERQRREPNQQREITICIAQAHQSVGDDGNARQELEKLLTDDTRDLQLLMQLVKLCEADGDLEAAVKYQQQVLKLAPGKDSTIRLAQLLMKSGETEEATALMSQSAVDEKDPESVLKSLDSLLNQDNYEQALAAIQKLLHEQPRNWELIYREGAALAKLKDRMAEAKERFEKILAMKNDDDELSILAGGQAQSNLPAAQVAAASIREDHPMVRRSQYSVLIRRAVGMLPTGARTTAAPILASGRTARTTVSASIIAAPATRATAQFWVPTDYGSARMACLAWLSVFASNEDKYQQFLDQRSHDISNSDNDRELMDYFYLTKITPDLRDDYQALKILSSRPNADAAVKAMYLTSLYNRGIEAGQVGVPVEDPDRDEGDAAIPVLPVLDDEELKHVIACYRSVVEASSIEGSNPLPQVFVTQIISSPSGGQRIMQRSMDELQVVVTELKRAAKRDEAEKMLGEALETVTAPILLAKNLEGAFRHADFESRMKLLDRLVKSNPQPSISPSTRSTAALNYARAATTPAFQSQIFQELMAERAQKGRFAEVLALVDRYSDAIVGHKQQRATATPATTIPPGTVRFTNPSRAPVTRLNLAVMRGNQLQSELLNFPTPNEIYDLPALRILRQAYIIFDDAKALNDLHRHFAQKIADQNTPEEQKAFWHFGLGYLYWWEDDKDEALSILNGASDIVTDNQVIKFELARLHEERGDNQRALELIDSLPAADQQLMQQRELAALRLAVSSGNVPRAKTAAERLFGLRLDSNLQIQLAQQMHQLEMHEQAEALLARAGRQAGNKTDVLLTLMQQYQAQGNRDTATQIAFQLLRRAGNSSGGMLTTARATATARTTAAGGRVVSARTEGNARQQALTVLKQSGKLPEMIKKVETQLQNAPRSQRLIETLIEYANADGNDKRAAELTARLVESKRDDPQFRYNIGQQLFQQGKHAEAVEHLKAAIAKDPRLLRNNYSQLIQAFQNANQSSQMASILESLDLKSNPENFIVVRYFFQFNSRNQASDDVTISLFKKVWNELPEQRQVLISGLGNSQIWKMPEIYDYVSELIVPASDADIRPDWWQGFGQLQTIANRGALGNIEITTLVNRLLAIAESNKKLEDLACKVDEARSRLPNWHAGKALAGLIDVRRGRIDEAKATLTACLPSVRDQRSGSYIPWEIGQELMDQEPCVDLAIQYFELACQNPRPLAVNGLPSPPILPLVNLYKKSGRFNEARRLLLSMNHPMSSNVRNERLESQMRIQNCIAIGAELRSLNFPMDAIRVYHEQLARTEDFKTYAMFFNSPNSLPSNQTPVGMVQADRMRQQIETELQSASQELIPDILPELIAGPTFGKGVDELASAIEPANAIVEPFNLILIVDSRDAEKAHLSSVIGKLVDRSAADPQLLAKTRLALAEALSTNRDDFGLRVLDVLSSLGDQNAGERSARVRGLIELADRMPLEAPRTKGVFTTIQRQSAMQQVALWLVARECRKQESLRASGTRLAERSLEAARRQTDNGFRLAILREWRQLADDSGDKATAERCRAELQEISAPKQPANPRARTGRTVPGPGF